MRVWEAQLGSVPRFELLVQADTLLEAVTKVEHIRKDRFDLQEFVSIRKIGELEEV